MTRKDYVKIAHALAETRKELVEGSGERSVMPDEVLDDAIRRLCCVLEQDNPRFDRSRFYTACKE